MAHCRFDDLALSLPLVALPGLGFGVVRVEGLEATELRDDS